MIQEAMQEKAAGGSPVPSPAPRDPVAAVVHPDPYPFYAQLVAGGGLRHDEALGMWVAARAADVSLVLNSSLCGVRPPGEPVPRVLAGRPAGDLFGRLIRQQDGPAQSAGKQAVSAALSSLPIGGIADVAGEWAEALSTELRPAGAPAAVDEFAFLLPGCAIGTLLGLPRDEVKSVVGEVGAFARGIGPSAGPVQVAAGHAAAARLSDRFRLLLHQQPAEKAGGLLPRIGAEIASRFASATAGEALTVANGIGFLSQAYEATAGLIGNTLIALARYRKSFGGSAASPDGLEVFAGGRGLVREVLRHDPPVQNTRRFMNEDGVVAGQALRRGDTILVVLAAANRDPAANPDPHRFDPCRPSPGCFTFGLGPHACPGETLAVAIAQAGVSALLRAGVDPSRLAAAFAYRPSANVRLPRFGAF